MDHGTVESRPRVQLAVQLLHWPIVGDLLRTLEITDGDESVVEAGAIDPLALQAARQAMMPVEINLQSERTPGGDARGANSQASRDCKN